MRLLRQGSVAVHSSVSCLQVMYSAWFVQKSRGLWDSEALSDVGIPQRYNKLQFLMERVALWTRADFLISAPMLFAFVARGSLVCSYLGVSYRTNVIWHR